MKQKTYLDILKKSSDYIIHEDNNILMVKITNFYSNYNTVKIINPNTRWCTIAIDSWERLSNRGYFFRVYDKNDNDIYSIYLNHNKKLRYIINSNHKRHMEKIKEWNIPFINNLEKE